MGTVTAGPKRDRTRVAIIGAGPAGLSLAHMLDRHGIDAIVLENRSEEYVRARVRAGILEQCTVEVLDQLGLADRLHREARRHEGFHLRFDGEVHHIDMHAETGRFAFLYPQAEVVADLIDGLEGRSTRIVFEAGDVRVDDYDTGEPVITYTDRDGSQHRIEADFVAGCDGFHGVSRATVADRVTVAERTYPFSWLGILAHSAPVAAEGTYSAHPDGMALHSSRGPELSRQYLQVPSDTRLDEWPDERIWAELRRRGAVDGMPEIESGEIIERSLAPLRSVVTEPMRIGSLFLLGDAAHIVPPTGAKGLNLAVSDACVLSRALGGYYADGRTDLLDAYTATALGRVWQAQTLSWHLTGLFHRLSDDPFDWPLRRARLRRLVDDEHERRSLSHAYLGLSFPSPWHYE